MQAIVRPHHYSTSGSHFRQASLDKGWLSFNNGAICIRCHLPMVARLELSYQQRDWLLAVALVSFFVGLASLGLRWLGWLDISPLVRVSASALEFGAQALAIIALGGYLLFPMRVLYLYGGSATPLMVTGSKKAIEEMEYSIWAFLQTRHQKQT